MRGVTTLTAAFAHFGAVPKNVLYAWSAVSPDGGTVVLTWWEDEVERRNGKLAYDTRNNSYNSPNIWGNRRGNRERTKNLIHARDYCGELFRIVWVTAADPRDTVRKIVARRPDDTLRMRLIELDEETGQFLAEEV